MLKYLALGAVAGLACTLGLLSSAHADGNEALGATLLEKGVGVGLASVGVGLAGRIDGAAPGTPSTSGSLVLTSVPAGATITRAFLYWTVYGKNGAGSVTMDGSSVAGTLIGTSAATCWAARPTYDLSSAPNRVYRADVTAKVKGNGTFVISGYPSLTKDDDTQGASLVVLYKDPAATESGTVSLFDGALSLVVRGSTSLALTFNDLGVGKVT